MLINFVYVNKQFRRAGEMLKLFEDKRPILKFEDSGICSSRYEELNGQIIINLARANMDSLKIKFLPFIKIRLAREIDIIMFSIYHELAHCLQYQKFPKWFLNCRSEWLDFEANAAGLIGTDINKKYRELKIEKCADKIACILFEKLEKKEGEQKWWIFK